MLKIRGCLRFRAKTLPCLWSRPFAGKNHFQCDRPVQAYLARFVDDSHPAAGDFFQQLVVTKVRDLGRPTRGRRLAGWKRKSVGERRGGSLETIVISEKRR